MCTVGVLALTMAVLQDEGGERYREAENDRPGDLTCTSVERAPLHRDDTTAGVGTGMSESEDRCAGAQVRRAQRMMREGAG